MRDVFDHPLVVFAVAFAVLCLAAYAGDFLRKQMSPSANGTEFGITLPAALTLLGLIIGFSFSLAVSRYDQRKNYEEDEANAIGTEYARADLLPVADAARVHELLVRYTEQRILFYQMRDTERLRQIAMQRAALQNSLWRAVVGPATVSRDPVSALVVVGMNDVINSQGYTQAAWWNRIPPGAWLLMGGVAIFCNLLVGYTERRVKPRTLLVLPTILAVSFLLISDIDSPRGGIINVHPRNLIALYQTISSH